MLELSAHDSHLYKKAFAGDTLNTAIYLKKELGEAHTVHYATKIGQDSISKELPSYLEKYNIETDLLQTSATKNIGLYAIDLVNGERHFTYWRNDSAAKTLFDDLSPACADDIMSHDYLYFSAISVAILNDKQAFFALIEQAKNKGKTIIYDANYRPALYTNKQQAQALHKQALKLATIYLPSIEDEQALSGELTATQIIEKSLALGVSEIVLKQGSEQIAYYENDEIKSIPIQPLQPVDTTSAGDSFNGAYLAARIKAHGKADSIGAGVHLSQQVIMQKGAIIF